MSTQIRPAAPADLAAVGAVVADAYLAAGAMSPDEPYLQQVRDAAGRSADALVLIADDDGEVLGSVTWCPPGSPSREIGRDGEGEFRMLGVAPSAQGRGIGRLLVEHCLQLARQSGHRAVVLSTGKSMTSAHRLYEAMGFRRLPDRDWSPRDGVHLLAYRLELTSPSPGR